MDVINIIDVYRFSPDYHDNEITQGSISVSDPLALYHWRRCFFCNWCNVLRYADDTVFYLYLFLFILMLILFTVALNNHKLVLNADKTKSMFFTTVKIIDIDNIY